MEVIQYVEKRKNNNYKRHNCIIYSIHFNFIMGDEKIDIEKNILSLFSIVIK
jgi:hypothetical protein